MFLLPEVSFFRFHPPMSRSNDGKRLVPALVDQAW
jgi:hypothetical protein